MAKRLKEFNFKNNPENKMPWSIWLNGEIWEVPRSETNYKTMVSFRAGVWGAAKRKGLKIRTHVNYDTEVLTFQAFGEDE